MSQSGDVFMHSCRCAPSAAPSPTRVLKAANSPGINARSSVFPDLGTRIVRVKIRTLRSGGLGRLAEHAVQKRIGALRAKICHHIGGNLQMILDVAAL